MGSPEEAKFVESPKGNQLHIRTEGRGLEPEKHLACLVFGIYSLAGFSLFAFFSGEYLAH